ncbi:hypothetical protein ACO22_03818 [Paracoccidioides brasiliensis]|uniref:Uncharacterized protein n=1 Tax=Paracoccidioides brasiliensis TaxID=121759 RepID=A0A1D2JEV6_PARBR|nr:hypothetical protein ACO22_03818 [Paracoccidioides brasiliensis]ODH47854.1 hypothetical protein GX48_06053 [Paracoccidioides brasiliensis]
MKESVIISNAAARDVFWSWGMSQLSNEVTPDAVTAADVRGVFKLQMNKQRAGVLESPHRHWEHKNTASGQNSFKAISSSFVDPMVAPLNSINDTEFQPGYSQNTVPIQFSKRRLREYKSGN